MKHPKWLLITVLILLAINLAFYGIWYAFDVQGKARVQLESFLSTTLNGTLKIQKLSINERQITVNNASFFDKASNISISINQIRVRYNLLRLIVSGFKFNKVIKEIVIYEPNAFVRFDLKPPSGKKPFEIPDLIPYFDNVSIKQGKLHLIFTAKLDSTANNVLIIEEKLDNIELTAKNTGKSDIILTAVSEKSGKFKIESTLDKGLLSETSLQVENFTPLSVSLTGFKQLSTNISLFLNYTKISKQSKPEYEINSTIRRTTAEYSKYQLYVPYIIVKGNKNVLQFSIRESEFDNHRFHIAGYISDLLTDPYIRAIVNLDRIDLQEFTKEISGVVTGKLNVETDFKAYSASGEILAPMIKIQNEEISNLAVKADYTKNNLAFTTNNFLWRNHTSMLQGNYNLTSQKANAHLILNPDSHNQDLKLNADIDADLDLSDNSILAQVEIQKLGFTNPSYIFEDFKGSITINGIDIAKKDFFIDLNLSNTSGLSLLANGTTGNRDLHAEVNFDSISINRYLPQLKYHKVLSGLSGNINADLINSEIMGNASVHIDMLSPKSLKAILNTSYKYNLDTQQGSVLFKADSATSQNIPFNLQFESKIDKKLVTLTDFRFNEVLYASGSLNLSDVYDSRFLIIADSIDVARYWNMFVPVTYPPPVSAILSMHLDYNQNNIGQVRGLLRADSIKIDQLKPLNAVVDFSGTTSLVKVSAEVQTQGESFVSAESQISVKPNININAHADFANFAVQDLFYSDNIKGIFNGKVNWNFSNKSDNNTKQNFACELTGNKIRIQDIPIDNFQLTASQLDEILRIDSLTVESKNLLNLIGSGALDYNIFTNNYYNGKHTLDIEFDGDLLRWAKSYVHFIENARGRVQLKATIQTNEDGINVSYGSFLMSNGMLRLKNQLETIKNLDLEGSILNNELDLKNLSCQIGSGKLFARNQIDPGGDNFFIGPLNLGYLLLHTDDTGIQVSIPDYLPPNTAATAVLKGQGSKEATIKGPFDDMEIIGEVIAYNGSVVYPANTKNIMQLINLFQKPERKGEDIPLPFTLDLLIKVQDNVHYVTYPAFLTCLPGSFLRLTYDGNMWNAQEADFVSEKGTLDFYGTTFQVEYVNVEINAQRNIIAINGTFTKKAADGTVVTLTVSTNPQKGPDVFSQLEFKLTSDNPQDKSITQILSRLRYNRNIEELTPEQRQSLLQDEAMQLISTSVTTTYVSQFLSPIENKIRRFLHLDNFTINTGFVQNLFVEFGTSNDQRTPFADSQNLNADILQFSSAVLLNNLSISMGKYLGSRIFLDYVIHLQETTDLANKTKLDLYHNASMRFNLPWRLKFIYTFSIRPVHEANSHEVMLQRSFRF